MRIRILGWKYVNIRKFKDVELDLTTDCKKISLIMMRNGTGKTTTINLIRAVLSGKAETWNAQEVRAFRPKNHEVEKGEFHLKIEYGNKKFHYILYLDYLMGKAYFQTSSFEERGGLEDGRKLPVNLRSVLNQEEFVNRFIFDGEQAKKTLGIGNQEAEKAIIYLYEVNKLDDLISQINYLVKIKQENSDKSFERSIKIYKGKMEKGEKLYWNLIETLEKHKQAIYNYEENFKNLNNKYEDIIAADVKLKNERNRLLSEEKKIREQLRVLMGDILEQSKKPYNVSSILDNRLKWLAKNMQVLKLPKATAQEFFKELAESPRCVCGHCIGKEEKEAILTNAKKYLGQEQLVVLNAIKHTLREYESSDVIKRRLDELENLVDQLHKLENDLDRIELEVENRGNDEIAQIKDDIDALQENIRSLQSKCELLETKDYNTYPYLNENTNIEKAKKFWESAKENYLRETDTYEFTKKAESVKQYISKIKVKTLEKLKENILLEANRKIEQIISNDFIEIEKIEGHLVLKGRAAVSEGQTLAVAYAYIGSLFEHSQIEFPFVVDSPAASMDLEVRREVASILPELFQQLIIFVTSGEVAGFGESFYGLESVRYITVEESCGSIKCTEGKDYFSQFQVEEG